MATVVWVGNSVCGKNPLHNLEGVTTTKTKQTVGMSMSEATLVVMEEVLRWREREVVEKEMQKDLRAHFEPSGL